MAWFTSTTPVLDQLGATMGQGVTPSYGGVDYTSLLENEQKQAQANADRDYGLKKQQLDQNYQISRQSARTQQERNQIDKEYQQATIKLAQDRLAEEHRQFDTTTGYNLIKTAAELRGPQNYFQASQYARGVNAQPGTATFLDALKNNSGLTSYGAQYGVPDKVSLSNILGGGGGDGSGWSSQGSGGSSGSSGSADDYRLNQIRGLYARGAHQLGAGSLENLTDTERKLLMSGIDEVGGDSSTFLDQYQRSRIGQGFGASRAA